MKMVFEEPPWVARFTVPGPPHAQGRARARIVPGKGDRKPFVSVYDPPESRSWKGTAQVHMAEAMKCGDGDAIRPPMMGPVYVSILAIFECPMGEHRKREPMRRRPHGKAGADCDNIAKAVMDAGNGVLWIDDRQVCRLTVEKIIGAQGEAPRVEVEVTLA